MFSVRPVNSPASRVLNQNARDIAQAMVGTVQRVLVEKTSTRDAGEFTGRTENMRYVNFAGHPRMIGQFVDVLITEVMANSLRGRVQQQGINGRIEA